MSQNAFNPDHIERIEQFENPYTNSVNNTTEIQSYRENASPGSNEEYTLSGRIIRLNNINHIQFADIRDETGVIQIVFREDYTDDYETAENLTVGDYITVTGNPIETDTGEFSLHVDSWRVLTPTVRDVPIRTGLNEQEASHDRVGALLTDDELYSSVRLRFETIQSIRDFLIDRDFMEVQTPILQSQSSGASAMPFETYSNSLEQQMELRVSPEINLKRLVISGYESIFEIGPNFRNEDSDTTHSPEFTMLELYQAGSNYEDMMALTESLITSLVEDVRGQTQIEYNGMTIDFERPWDRIEYISAIEDVVGEGIREWSTSEIIGYVEDEYGETVGDRFEALEIIYDQEVEEEIEDPTFITDHPRSSTPLCASHEDDASQLERFELVIAGMEIANAYSELTDPIQQERAFDEQSSTSYGEDMEFVEDLGYGLPPTGGLGIGIDRIVMMLANQNSIQQVRPFPQSRS